MGIPIKNISLSELNFERALEVPGKINFTILSVLEQSKGR